MFDNMKRFARAQDTAAIDAVRLGDELRASREATGVSLEEMATRLRIRRVYLLALEEGRLRDLPSAAYAIGFVRNYAGALGLDASDTVRRFREAVLGQGGRKTDLVFPEPVPERGFPAGVVVLLGTVIAIGSYVGWYSFSGGSGRVVDAVPQLPPRLEATARDGEALRAPPVQGQAAPSLPALPVPTPVPVQLPAPPVAAAPAPTPPPADQSRITLRFKAEAWTQVRDPRTNQQLLNRVMRAGESFAVPNREGLLLSTGSAQATEVLVDGQVSAVFNGVTGVRRDIPLQPDRLRTANPAQPGAAPRPAAGAPAQGPAPAATPRPQ
ncbi:MAG TPA: RodZ domain-containing protein [Roseococcus sp.]|nr:RodZ domain-containing protein [Roseococcus sp.]